MRAQVRAVEDASFDVKLGKTLGIVGERGCGKSVTVRSILRIVERPGRIVAGQVLLYRNDPEGPSTEVDLTQLEANGGEMLAIRERRLRSSFKSR